MFSFLKAGLDLGKTGLAARMFFASRIETDFNSSGLCARVRLFALEAFDMGGDTHDRFFPARDFVADACLAADGFELLLPELFDHPIFGVAPFRHFGKDRAG